MKSYDEYKEDMIAEGVDPQDKKAWTDFVRAAEALENVLRRPNSLHYMIFGDIEFAMEKVHKQLERLDAVYRWKDQRQQRRERMKTTIVPQQD